MLVFHRSCPKSRDVNKDFGRPSLSTRPRFARVLLAMPLCNNASILFSPELRTLAELEHVELRASFWDPANETTKELRP